MDDHPATTGRDKLIKVLSDMTHVEGGGIYCGVEQLAQINGEFNEETLYAAIKDIEGKSEYGIISNGGIYHNKELIATITNGMIRLENAWKSSSLCMIDDDGIVNHGIFRDRSNRSQSYKSIIAELKEQQREDLKQVDEIYESQQKTKKPTFYQKLVSSALKLIGKKDIKQIDKDINYELDIL